MTKQLTLLALILCFNYISKAQTSLQGKITAADTGEELISANVVAVRNGAFVAGVSTDFNGNYSISLDPGTYDVEVSYLGYPNHLVVGVVVKPGQVNNLNIEMPEPKIICCLCHFFYSPPLIDLDNTSSGTTLTTNNIQNSPFRDINDLILNTAGVSPANY